MNVNLFSHFGRFVLLFLLQVFIFKQITFGWGGKELLFIYVYPLFILLLPFNVPNALNIFMAFCMGLSIDLFYETLGLHASAATFTAFVRPFVTQRLVKPREGYTSKDQPTKEMLGDRWFVRYTAVMLIFHFAFFFSVEAFTFVYVADILAKTILTGLASFIFIMAGVYVFRPKV